MNALFPFFSAKADSSKSLTDCPCIDFDDGDHRAVPLHRIRILPDYFSNLTELGVVTMEGRRSQTSLSSNLSISFSPALPSISDNQRLNSRKRWQKAKSEVRISQRCGRSMGRNTVTLNEDLPTVSGEA